MRLAIRDLRPDDEPRVLAWRNQPSVARHMLTAHVITEAEHRNWWRSGRTDARSRYWIVEADEQPVGLWSLTDLTADRCSWGFYLADEATRGQGVGTWAAATVLDHAFSGLGLRDVWAEVLVANARGLAFHCALGFVEDGRRTLPATAHRAAVEVRRLTLPRDRWAAGRDGLRAHLQTRGLWVPD
ncbi:UDP-4-amino-4,6-dideoxy-N-acetyl-beta-L-altrosamine N-acetyltransferase [Rubrivirga sp. IMCC43871]|uniref:UDP-4-amino-4, 6-dideoxy-N-acetyl-beta-L-altrosamine N-acetyltransferase n=1 Tax=Rubrivirga sp. IMCC43871 TaxID=3391575 RepID=UPI00398FF049